MLIHDVILLTKFTRVFLIFYLKDITVIVSTRIFCTVYIVFIYKINALYCILLQN